MPQKKSKAREKLNEKQIAFCYEYVANNFNGTKAHLAVYKGKSENAAGVEANKRLKKPKVKALIKKLTEKHLTKLSYTANDVLKELSKNAFSDIKDFVSWSKDSGVIIKNTEELGEFTSCIREIKIDAREIMEDGKPTGIKDYKIDLKLHDKVKSLELLGKNLLLFVDRLKVEKDDATEKFERIAKIMDEECRPSEDRSDNTDTV